MDFTSHNRIWFNIYDILWLRYLLTTTLFTTKLSFVSRDIMCRRNKWKKIIVSKWQISWPKNMLSTWYVPRSLDVSTDKHSCATHHGTITAFANPASHRATTSVPVERMFRRLLYDSCIIKYDCDIYTADNRKRNHKVYKYHIEVVPSV